MINTDRALKKDRACLALTGMTPVEIYQLLPVFTACLRAQYDIRRPKRERKFGGGQKGSLKSPLQKLVFVLFYLKTYPTYDVMEIFIDLDHSRCCRNVQFLLPVLEKTLGRTISLPQRRINSVEEFIKLFPEVKDVFVDGTERRTRRPRNKKKQNKLYSGKKKSTTRKTIVVNDEYKRILVLTPTKSGRRHDKRLVDKNHLARAIPKHVAIWVDTGFQGTQKQHPNVVMPKKGRKKHPLTPDEKLNNKAISSIRVISEHAICGMKRFGAAADVYRNRLKNLDDTFNLLAAGLWNFHLQQTS